MIRKAPCHVKSEGRVLVECGEGPGSISCVWGDGVRTARSKGQGPVLVCEPQLGILETQKGSEVTHASILSGAVSYTHLTLPTMAVV